MAGQRPDGPGALARRGGARSLAGRRPRASSWAPCCSGLGRLAPSPVWRWRRARRGWASCGACWDGAGRPRPAVLDPLMRRVIDGPLTARRRLAGRSRRHRQPGDPGRLRGRTRDETAMAALADQLYLPALVLIGLNRLADGLDGAVARKRGVTDLGGYLDIVLDFSSTPAWSSASPWGAAGPGPGGRLPDLRLRRHRLLLPGLCDHRRQARPDHRTCAAASRSTTSAA